MKFHRRPADAGHAEGDRGECRGTFPASPPAGKRLNSAPHKDTQGELGDFSSVHTRRSNQSSEELEVAGRSSTKTLETPPVGSENTLQTRRNLPFQGRGELGQKVPLSWRTHFRRLAPGHPLAGMSAARWRIYYADASWLLATHGETLADEGWALPDLFRISAYSFGGLIQFLSGARDLAITGMTARFTRSVIACEFEATGDEATGWIGRAPWQP